jgi:uncharacterized protein (TIGR02246 family)
MVGRPVADNNHHFCAAAARGDAHAMASVYEPDAELLPPNAEAIRGREAIERFWQGGLEMGVRVVEFKMLRFEKADGLAYEVGRFTLSIDGDDGLPTLDRGKYVVVLRRQPDGSWLRAVEIFNSNAQLP